MNDRELLKLAARAAGLTPIEEEHWEDGQFRLFLLDEGREWNPLTDDGDALRLAVMLGMQVSIDLKKRCATALIDEGETVPCEWFDEGQQDPGAAGRRAIVRAAAEIGRRKTV